MNENIKKGIKMMQGYLAGFQENSKKLFLCQNCTHKNVCKKIEDKEEQCADFSDATTYQRYSSIYHFFDPIFDWMKFHYPAGEVKFVVDHNSARMMLEHGVSVFSREINGSVDLARMACQNDDKETKPEQHHTRTY